MRALGVAALGLLVCACGDERAGIAPIGSTSGMRPSAEAVEPSPHVVSPHTRRAPRDEPPAPRAGGGGGDWDPRPEPPPSERDTAAFRAELASEIASHVDGDDEPCEQLRGVMQAASDANERPGREMPDAPSRAEMREPCQRLPEALRQCLDREYFAANQQECQQEMERLAARGRRVSDRARERHERIRRGREPWPGQRTSPSEREPSDEAEDDG